MEEDESSTAEALSKVVSILSALSEDNRRRVLSAVSSFFGSITFAPEQIADSPQQPIPSGQWPKFSGDFSPSPKEFLLQKQPKTDVERIACLAYYLHHFRDTPHFKTLDLAKLNTEAAQPKFSNAAYSAKNALSMGYLAPSTKGQRQLSAAGELFVVALPDRDAAKHAMASARPRRPFNRKKSDRDEKSENEDDRPTAS